MNKGRVTQLPIAERKYHMPHPEVDKFSKQASVAFRKGNLSAAATYYEDALLTCIQNLEREESNARYLDKAFILRRLAVTIYKIEAPDDASKKKNTERARDYLQQSITIHEEHLNTSALSSDVQYIEYQSCLSSICHIAADLKDNQGPLIEASASKLAKLAEDTRNVKFEYSAYDYLFMVYFSKGDFDNAAIACLRCIEVAQQYNKLQKSISSPIEGKDQTPKEIGDYDSERENDTIEYHTQYRHLDKILLVDPKNPLLNALIAYNNGKTRAAAEADTKGKPGESSEYFVRYKNLKVKPLPGNLWECYDGHKALKTDLLRSRSSLLEKRKALTERPLTQSELAPYTQIFQDSDEESESPSQRISEQRSQIERQLQRNKAQLSNTHRLLKADITLIFHIEAHHKQNTTKAYRYAMTQAHIHLPGGYKHRIKVTTPLKTEAASRTLSKDSKEQTGLLFEYCKDPHKKDSLGRWYLHKTDNRTSQEERPIMPIKVEITVPKHISTLNKMRLNPKFKNRLQRAHDGAIYINNAKHIMLLDDITRELDCTLTEKFSCQSIETQLADKRATLDKGDSLPLHFQYFSEIEPPQLTLKTPKASGSHHPERKKKPTAEAFPLSPFAYSHSNQPPQSSLFSAGRATPIKKESLQPPTPTATKGAVKPTSGPDSASDDELDFDFRPQRPPS